MKNKKTWNIVLCVLLVAMVFLCGGLWFRANIPLKVYDSFHRLDRLETDEVTEASVDYSSTLYRTWGGVRLENSRKDFSNYIEEDSYPPVFNKDARLAVYVTKDCPYTTGYFRRAFGDLKYAHLRLVRVEHSRADVIQKWPEVEEVVFGEQFSVRCMVVQAFDPVLGEQILVAVDGPEAEEAKAYLEENYKGYVSVLPRDQIRSYDPELLYTNGKTGSSKKYLYGGR